jgi:protein disulfide-isomerase A1
VSNKQQREAYVAEMRPLANKYEEYLHFVTTDVNEYPNAAEMMGLRGGSSGLSVQNPNNGDVYPYTRKDRISARTVEAFLGDIIQGKVRPWRPGAGHDEL